MKTLITIILMVSSSMVFAGGSGGGGVMASKMMSTHLEGAEIVYHMGEKDGLVKFAYAQLVNNQWQVKKYLLQGSTLEQSEKIALLKSRSLNNWAPLKQH